MPENGPDSQTLAEALFYALDERNLANSPKQIGITLATLGIEIIMCGIKDEDEAVAACMGLFDVFRSHLRAKVEEME